jgi:t-SNARE complex subunit (syntaxin)
MFEDPERKIRHNFTHLTVAELNNRSTYAKVAGKYQDVLTLEQSVAELHQMFLDFALLTEQQGELLDQIEFQVKQAGDYVEEGNSDLVSGIEYQKKIRKKQW